MLTLETLKKTFRQDELLQIAGSGPRDDRVFDVDRIDAACAYANGLVQGYARDRWPQVLVAPSSLLDGYAADIARWHLRGQGGQQAQMNDVVQKRYDEAIARLKDVAAGKLTPDFATDVSVAGSDTDHASNELAVVGLMPQTRIPTLLEEFRR